MSTSSWNQSTCTTSTRRSTAGRRSNQRNPASSRSNPQHQYNETPNSSSSHREAETPRHPVESLRPGIDVRAARWTSQRTTPAENLLLDACDDEEFWENRFEWMMQMQMEEASWSGEESADSRAQHRVSQEEQQLQQGKASQDDDHNNITSVNVSRRSISFSPLITVFGLPEATCNSSDDGSQQEADTPQPDTNMVCVADTHSCNKNESLEENHRIEEGRTPPITLESSMHEPELIASPLLGCDTTSTVDQLSEQGSEDSLQIQPFQKKALYQDESGTNLSIGSFKSYSNDPSKGRVAHKSINESAIQIVGIQTALDEDTSKPKSCSLVFQLGLAVGLGLVAAGCVLHFTRQAAMDP